MNIIDKLRWKGKWDRETVAWSIVGGIVGVILARLLQILW